MITEEYFIGGNPINILDCFVRKQIYTLKHQIKYLHIEN